MITGKRLGCNRIIQEKLAEEKGYLVPSFIEMITGIFTEYSRSRTFLYDEGTFTRIQEDVGNLHNETIHMTVGGFDESGPIINCPGTDSDCEKLGVAGVRRFKVNGT